MNSLLDSITFISSQVIAHLSLFFPRILAAFLVLLIGVAIAKTVKKITTSLFEKLRFSKAIEKTPVEDFLENAEVGTKIEEIVGSLFYWLVMLIVIQTAVSVLGLTSLSVLLEKVLGYIPRVFSAIIVLFFGIILAGAVESMVKGAVRTVDGRSARLLSKVASYLIMIIVILAAVSELGIAKDFILVLFIGVVGTLVLGIGLALGLGGQHLVKDFLSEWYKKNHTDVTDEAKK